MITRATTGLADDEPTGTTFAHVQARLAEMARALETQQRILHEQRARLAARIAAGDDHHPICVPGRSDLLRRD